MAENAQLGTRKRGSEEQATSTKKQKTRSAGKDQKHDEMFDIPKALRGASLSSIAHQNPDGAMAEMLRGEKTDKSAARKAAVDTLGTIVQEFQESHYDALDLTIDRARLTREARERHRIYAREAVQINFDIQSAAYFGETTAAMARLVPRGKGMDAFVQDSKKDVEKAEKSEKAAILLAQKLYADIEKLKKFEHEFKNQLA